MGGVLSALGGDPARGLPWPRVARNLPTALIAEQGTMRESVERPLALAGLVLHSCWSFEDKRLQRTASRRAKPAPFAAAFNRNAMLLCWNAQLHA